MGPKEKGGKLEVNVEKFAKQFQDFVDATEEARAISDKCRDYRDGKQWTADEVQVLQARGQAPIVINRIAPKVNALMGMEINNRVDPRAYPRNPKDDRSALAVTQALRYVEESTRFDSIASKVFEEVNVEGYSGCIVEVDDDTNIAIREIDYSRIYFDPHSRRKDFKDARFLGIVIWMDKEVAEERWGEVVDEAFVSSSVETETFEDKPTWVDKKRARIKVCEHYYIHKGVWHLCYFSGDKILEKPIPSPYVDEKERPICPIELESVFVDRENNRYGLVKEWLDIQDEINHRRSKALHLLSVRQTASQRGAVADVEEMKYELSKPNGHVEVNGEIGTSFQILSTADMAQAQFSLLQEAKNEIDSQGVNAALAGRETRDLSGRALQQLRQGGMAEIAPSFDQHRDWKLRVYRQIWMRIKQFWTEEKWIRVTDDPESMKFVGFNYPVTVGELLTERAQQGDQQAQAMLQRLINDPRLNEVAEMRNNPAELDLDVIVEEVPDMASLQHEQFQFLVELAGTYGREAVPFELLLEASSLPNKKVLLDKMRGGDERMAAQQAQQQDMAMQMHQLQMANEQAKLEKTISEAQKVGAEADQIEMENEILLAAPSPVTSVSI